MNGGYDSSPHCSRVLCAILGSTISEMESTGYSFVIIIIIIIIIITFVGL